MVKSNVKVIGGEVRRSANPLNSARKNTSGQAQTREATLLVIRQPATTSFFFSLLTLNLVFIIMLSSFTFLFPSLLFLSASALELSSGNVEKFTGLELKVSAPTISLLTDVHAASHPTFSGFKEPIDPNGTSIFKIGSTIPIKFQLNWPNGQPQSHATPADNKAQIFTAKVSDKVMTAELEATNKTTHEAVGSISSRGGPVGEAALPAAESSDAVAVSAGTADKPTPGNHFLYDPASNEFVFNLGTKQLSPGTWQIRIIFDDGSSQTANISLIK